MDKEHAFNMQNSFMILLLMLLSHPSKFLVGLSFWVAREHMARQGIGGLEPHSSQNMEIFSCMTHGVINALIFDTGTGEWRHDYWSHVIIVSSITELHSVFFRGRGWTSPKSLSLPFQWAWRQHGLPNLPYLNFPAIFQNGHNWPLFTAMTSTID